MFPRQKEMEVPVLRVLQSLGGKARPQEVYPAVTKSFPQLTEADLSEPLSSGGNKLRPTCPSRCPAAETSGQTEFSGSGRN